MDACGVGISLALGVFDEPGRDREMLFKGGFIFMSGTQIRQLEAANGAEYQALFLEALRSAPAAFAADYDEESARSSEHIAERFRREVIFGGFVSGRLYGIATFLQQMPQSGGTSGGSGTCMCRRSSGGPGLPTCSSSTFSMRLASRWIKWNCTSQLIALGDEGSIGNLD